MRSVRYAVVVTVTAIALGGLLSPAPVLAQGEDSDYDLSFSLPTYGKSGCMVCHGDRNLVRVQGSQTYSYWIDDAIIRESAHAGIMCTGCHTDFSFKAPHTEAGEDWRETAKISCKNCHVDQYNAYSLGVHSISSKPGEEADPDAEVKPLCGDCHGSHDIEMLTDNPQGQANLHARGQEVCGVCHKTEYENYDDYYHGKAYTRGAPDAPACWTCHGYHDILPLSDRRSPVSEGQLLATCGQCHQDVTDGYLSYTPLIHGRDDALAANPLYVWLSQVRNSISGLFAGIFGMTAATLVE